MFSPARRTQQRRTAPHPTVHLVISARTAYAIRAYALTLVTARTDTFILVVLARSGHASRATLARPMRVSAVAGLAPSTTVSLTRRRPPTIQARSALPTPRRRRARSVAKRGPVAEQEEQRAVTKEEPA